MLAGGVGVDLCCWIGSGWCQTNESAERKKISGDHSGLTGVRGKNRKPLLGGDGTGKIQRGVTREFPKEKQGRPQLADAYSRGRGIHGNDSASTCSERREWLINWFQALRNRLRTVRVCCGDWLRVCDSESVTTRLGTTGIFFDPPYGAAAGRTKNIYAQDSDTVAEAVRKYCLDRGNNKMMRICLAGYEGEGHEELEENGWSVVSWKAQGGYGNCSAKGKENAKKERLWYSPYCKPERKMSLW